VSVPATRQARPRVAGENDAVPTRLPPFRHQPPVHSPLPVRAFAPAAGQLLRLGADPRPGLAALLEAAYTADRVVLCSSGTAALQLAIRVAAASASEPGPIALPAYTCYDVAAAAVGADEGLGLALFDIDPMTLAPDLESLHRVLQAGARVVVVSPLYGIPVEWDAIQALCDEHGAVLVEDAAQGHGASWRGRPVGALGRISVLSFGRGKGWTGGKGGALLLRGAVASADLGTALGTAAASPIGEAAVLAGSLAQKVLARPSLYALPRALPWLHLGETRYRPPTPPEPMTRVAAALLRASREEADREADRRRGNGWFFRERLTGLTGVRIPVPPADARPGYLRFPVLIRGGAAALGPSVRVRRFGVERGYPRPLSELEPVQARLVGGAVRLTGADLLARELVTLPTGSLLSASEKQALVDLVRRSQP